MFLERRRQAARRSARRCVSGRATGVPGALAALDMAHRDHGRLPWNSLFGDAERTAADGFIVSPRLARMVAGNFPQNATPDVRAYFAQGPGGALVKAGDRLRNPAYADFLRRLARAGVRGDVRRRDRRADRRADPRRPARRKHDDGRPRRLSRRSAARPCAGRGGSTAPAFRRRRRAGSAMLHAARADSSAPTSPRAGRTTRRPGSCSPRRAG